MHNKKNLNFFFAGLFAVFFLVFNLSCNQQPEKKTDTVYTDTAALKPAIVTDTVLHDTDDPAIWINSNDKSQSLIIGTDKDENGALYVFDLNGKELKNKTVKGLNRPNNVDIEYGLMLAGKPTDIAVVSERYTHKLRIYSLPDMLPVDNGGIPVFEGEILPGYRDLMGIGLYKNEAGNIYAIAGRKTGPKDSGYLWQYMLTDDGTGHVKATLVRKFGQFSGIKEIESIAVDDKMGFVYYSDEGVGVRKYYAEPVKGNTELALFGNGLFKEDNEGISVYPLSDSMGYILVSNQQVNTFLVFSRSGTKENPHQHQLLAEIPFSTLESDGSDVTPYMLNSTFPKGLFVAMSTDKVFHYYDWRDIEKRILQAKENKL